VVVGPGLRQEQARSTCLLGDECDCFPHVVRELGVEVDGHAVRVAPLVELLRVGGIVGVGWGVAGTAMESGRPPAREASAAGPPPRPSPVPQYLRRRHRSSEGAGPRLLHAGARIDQVGRGPGRVKGWGERMTWGSHAWVVEMKERYKG
jgi:hypothetical protein